MAHQEQVDKEVEQLKKDIVRLGSINADGQYEVPFGVLFDDEQAQQFYEAIVGTIKAGKKKGVVDAKGMIWLKGAHDNVPIKLLEKPATEEPPASASIFQFYPIGSAGTPWGDAEKAAWLESTAVQRSYQDEVLVKVDGLRRRLTCFSMVRCQSMQTSTR